MNLHAVGGLGLGLFVILVGIGWIGGAISHQKRHAEFAQTYAATGGPLYAISQIGCAAVIIVVGIAIIAILAYNGFK